MIYKLVSVIIPTYNSERTIQKCLESIKNQTYENIEIIVVDNNSKDSTVSKAKIFTSNVFNKGPERSSQRNYGVKVSKGEYILVHDSDIYFDKDVVKNCIEEIGRSKLDALIIPEISIGIGFWAKVKSFERSFYQGNDYIEAARFFRRSIFQEVGGYDENLVAGEDWDLNIRIKNSGYKIGRISTPVYHDEGSLSLFQSSKKKKYYANDLYNKYAKKHPFEFKKQMSFFIRFPVIKLIYKSISHPILMLGVLVLKSVEYLRSKNYF